jgi:hypothetical protein
LHTCQVQQKVLFLGVVLVEPQIDPMVDHLALEPTLLLQVVRLGLGCRDEAGLLYRLAAIGHLAVYSVEQLQLGPLALGQVGVACPGVVMDNVKVLEGGLEGEVGCLFRVVQARGAGGADREPLPLGALRRQHEDSMSHLA